MAVVKLSRSGRAVQFIIGDEEVVPGTVFQVSASLIAAAAGNGRINGDFVPLSRMPLPVRGTKYPASPVWNPGGEQLSVAVEKGGIDPSGKGFIEVREQQKVKDKSKGFSPW